MLGDKMMETTKAAERATLTVPAEPSALSALRACAAVVAAGEGFTVEDIDELKNAVEEAALLMIEETSSITMKLVSTLEGIEAYVSPASPIKIEAEDEFPWLIITATCDAAEVLDSGTITFRKRSSLSGVA